MDTSKTTDKTKVYVPLFLQDVPDEVQYFFEIGEILMNADKTKLYLNPLGFCSIQESFTLNVGFHKENGKVILNDGLSLIPSTLQPGDKAPKGWIVIEIEAVNADSLYAHTDIVEEVKEELTLDEVWNEYNAAGAVEVLILKLLSLKRSSIDQVSSLPIVKAMVRKTNLIIQKESNHNSLDKVFRMLDDEIFPYENKTDEIVEKPEPEYITILKKVRKVADQKLATLLTPKIVEVFELPSLGEITMEELKKRIKEYSAEELQNFISDGTLMGGVDDGYEKATLIREHLKAT